jgi:hypothetical protein
MSSVWIGVALSCTASFMNALGLNLTRMSSGKKTGEKDKLTHNLQCHQKFNISITPSVLAILGVLLSSLCGVVDVVSYGYAPQSTLAPLGSFTLVVNLLFAPILHDENIKLKDAIQTITIITGVVCCILSSSQKDETANAVETPSTHTPKDLYNLSMNASFHKLVMVASFIVVSLAFHLYRQTKDGFENELSTGFVYPVVAGMFGGATVLCAKIFTTLITFIDEIDVFTVLMPIGILLATFAILQVIINGKGLSRHSSLVMVPIYSSSFVLSNAIGGGIYFQEFSNFNNKQWTMYLSGVVLVVGGVLWMAASKQAELATVVNEFFKINTDQRSFVMKKKSSRSKTPVLKRTSKKVIKNKSSSSVIRRSKNKQ